MGDREIGRAKASPSRSSHTDRTRDCTIWNQCVDLVVVDNGIAGCCDSADRNYRSAREGIAFDRSEQADKRWIESEYGGVNLTEWAESQAGLPKTPLALRLHILVDIAKAVAAAHEVGVLHKDLKAANILVSSQTREHQADRQPC